MIEIEASKIDAAVDESGVDTLNKTGRLVIIRGADTAVTLLLTEITTENDAKLAPTASQAEKVASDSMIEAALQLVSETAETLLDAMTHNGARIVLPDESETRAKNWDKCMRPRGEGCPMILFKN